MLRQLLLVTLGLAVCFMGSAEAGGRRGRGRRRRRRRNKQPATSTPCGTCSDDHQVAATGSFKGGKDKKGKLSEGEGACDCLNLCAGELYYQVQQKKGGAQDCYCASGKLKKMKKSKKAFLGAVTVELSTTLAEMAEKSSVTPNTVCSAETPAPTGSPTLSPTASPSASPTASPTANPTASPTYSPSGYPTESPTLNPTASPTTRYVVGTQGSNECPEGSTPIRSMDACWAAAASLSIVADDGSRRWTGEADGVPPRCSYQAGGDSAPHWNTKVGNNDGAYTPICDQGPPAADMLLMHLLGGSDNISAANVWNNGGVSNSDEASNYRSDAVSSWGAIVARDYKYVKVSVMEDGGNTEAQYMTFSTDMTDSTNWYSKAKVAGSSWNLDSWTGEGEQYFQLNEQCCGREFLVSHNYGGCDQDNGWLNLDAASQWVGGKRGATKWGGQYSEENGGWSGRSTKPFVGGWCGGGNCDNHKNIWADDLGDWHGNVANWGGEVSDNRSWTGSHWIETTYQCPANEVVSELRCQGSRCDNITVYCSGPITTTDYRLLNADANTHWAPWFSEEGNGQGWCGENQVIIGLQCKGDYCDDMSWRCREFQKDIKNDPCQWEHDDKSASWKNDGHKFQIIYSKGAANENFLNGNVARAHSVKITATNTL